VSPDLRAECAARTVEMGFDGYAVGGLSVGEPLEATLPALAAALAHLPPDRPRYLMGVGDPVSILEAVLLGVDMFDCVLPTRLARHGTALTDRGRVQAKAGRFATENAPIDPGCDCPVCQRYSAGYLRHLLVVGEQTGGRLLTIHNVHWLLRFVEKVRKAIESGTTAGLRLTLGEAWRTEPLR
jgi:queuine tRNA-ribosyltransferase